jgi:hypothetical protein
VWTFEDGSLIISVSFNFAALDFHGGGGAFWLMMDSGATKRSTYYVQQSMVHELNCQTEIPIHIQYTSKYVLKIEGKFSIFTLLIA